MTLRDYHVHSNYSADAHATMEEMCRAAIALGVPEIGFAEHYDLHPDEKPRDWLRLDPWLEELERCRAAFDGRLVIRAGIEIGEPHLFQVEMKRILARAPFDYAIGSLHWVGRNSIFDHGYFQQPAPEAFGLYFQELERMTRAGGFDVLGHLDVPVRTAFAHYGSYDPRQYETLIRPVLRNCIEHGIALDVNTSALRRQARVLLPDLEILRWYAEMGGMRVTLGSDAHRPEEVAEHFDVALEAIKTSGIRNVVQYERRLPRLIPI
ncbi:MAG: histidinol-phosphatase HisJ family protein [Acidobacteriia bacterium]|nr:histidinol-phosphatase HisJ family protein [Terriglobia bacterium]